MTVMNPYNVYIGFVRKIIKIDSMNLFNYLEDHYTIYNIVLRKRYAREELFR